MPTVDILMQFLTTGRFLVLAGEKTFCIQGEESEEGTDAGALGFDIYSGKRKYNLPVLLTGASLSPDGRTGASVAVDWAPALNEPSPAVVSLWSFDDGTRLRQLSLPGGRVVEGDERPFGIFSPDSRYFVVAPGDAAHHIHVIDVQEARDSLDAQIA